MFSVRQKLSYRLFTLDLAKCFGFNKILRLWCFSVRAHLDDPCLTTHFSAVGLALVTLSSPHTVQFNHKKPPVLDKGTLGFLSCISVILLAREANNVGIAGKALNSQWPHTQTLIGQKNRNTDKTKSVNENRILLHIAIQGVLA